MSRAKYPALRLAFAVPNGAWTMNKAMAVKLKREGLRVGVPDWILPVRTQFYAGLAIEFKRSPGVKLSNQQAEYHELMRSHGWSVHVCTTWQSAAAVVEEYLK
ncbi:MAG: VRR-NUC domain-containing protein [Pseudomonadota bacterium]